MSIFRRSTPVALLLAAGLAVGCSSEVKIGAVISESGAVAPYGYNVIGAGWTWRWKRSTPRVASRAARSS